MDVVRGAWGTYAGRAQSNVPEATMTLERGSRRAIMRTIAVLILVSLVGCSSCSDVLEILEHFGVKDVDLGVLHRLVSANKADGLDYFLRVKAKKTGGEFRSRLDWDLNIPYRVETTSGFTSLAGAVAATNTKLGLEFDYVGSSPLDYYRLSAGYTAGSAQVVASSSSGGVAQTLGQLSFPGVHELDYAFENTGTKLNFWAAPRGVRPLQLVASPTSPSDSRNLRASLWATGLTKGSDLVFDNFNVFNGPLTGTPNNHAFIHDGVFRPMSSALDGFYRLDAFPRDVSGARASLQTASTAQANIAVQFQLRFKAPDPNVILKKLQSAKTALDSAVAQIDAGKAATEKGRTKILATIKKAVFLDFQSLSLFSRVP